MKYSQEGQKYGGRDPDFQRDTLIIANNVTKLGSGKRYKVGKYTSTVFLLWEQQQVVFHHHVDNSVSVCMCECVFDKHTIIDRSNDIIHIKLLSYSCISYMLHALGHAFLQVAQHMRGCRLEKFKKPTAFILDIKEGNV